MPNNTPLRVMSLIHIRSKAFCNVEVSPYRALNMMIAISVTWLKYASKMMQPHSSENI